MTFQANPPEVHSALIEAARRTGFQYLSGDVASGTAVFTSGRLLLGIGEKVTARMRQVAPGSVEVTLASGSKVGWSGRGGPSVNRLCEALSGLLPHTG